MLSNVYLNELDRFVAKMANEFFLPKSRTRTVEYDKLLAKKVNINSRLNDATGIEKIELLKHLKELKAQLRKTPYTSKTDKVMKYVRYADDFIIGVKGDRADCEAIKGRLSEFISRTLKMELSEEKTLITHSNQYARFLGYDVRVRRDSKVKATGKYKQRTLNNKTELCVPLEDKIIPFLFDKSIIEQSADGTLKPVARKYLYGCTDLEILSTYNAELRGICNYYGLASNFNKLSYFAYFMEYSCLKTLAGKHKSTSRKIINKYSDGGSWSIPYKTANGKETRRKFAKFMDCKDSDSFSDTVDSAIRFAKARTTLEKRLSAKTCELCNKTDVPLEMHHVNKVKNLKGKQHWEIVMIAKRRKTLAVCKDCHHKIHHP